MSTKQSYIMTLLIGMAMGITLLVVIVKVNGELDDSRMASVSLQKQIDQLKKANIDQDKQMDKLSVRIDETNKDVDATQALQRTQAQAILALRKHRQ